MPWSHITPPTRTIYILDAPEGRRWSFQPWPIGLPGDHSRVVIVTPTAAHITDDGRCLWIDHLAPEFGREIDARRALEMAAAGEHGFRVESADPPPPLQECDPGPAQTPPGMGSPS